MFYISLLLALLAVACLIFVPNTVILLSFVAIMHGFAVYSACHALLHKRDSRAALGWIAIILFMPPGRAAAVLAVRDRPDRQPSRPAYGKSRPESHGRPCGPARQITDGKTGRVHRQGRSPARMALPRQPRLQHHRPLYARRQRPHRAAQRRSRLSGHAQGHQRGQGTGLPVEFHFRLRRSGQELRRRPARRCRTRMRRAPAHGRRGLLPLVAELAQTPRPGRQARLLPAAAPHPAPVFHQPADAPQSPDLRQRNRLHRRHEHFPEPPRQPEAPLTGAGRALPLPRPHRAAA